MKVTMRDEAAVLQLIDLCSSLEEKALAIYGNLEESAVTPRLRSLWGAMKADEEEHRQYWLRLKEVCAQGGVPEVFDEPRRYVDELRTLAVRVDHIESQLRAEPSVPLTFVNALRLEFLLLHPSFVTLFHYLPDTPVEVSPSKTYEQHLGRLLSALMDYQELSPELELLGETIGQVWRKSEEVVTRAVTDIMTGTLNRRGLYIAMKPLACLARRDRETAGIVIAEITNLKELNGRHGHGVGDTLLAATARAVTLRLRSSDVVGRFGGDDFLALLTRFDPTRFNDVCEEVLRQVEKVDVEGARPAMTIGGAHTVMGEKVEDQLEALIREADRALHEARSSGNRCVVRAI